MNVLLRVLRCMSKSFCLVLAACGGGNDGGDAGGAAPGAGTVVGAAGGTVSGPNGASVLVLPFDNPKQEPRLTWMREGAAVLLTDLLAVSGERVIDREERLRAFDRLQLPVTAGLSRASSIKVGQAVAAGVVVIGALELSGDQLTARGRVVRLDTGRLLPELQASGPLSDLFGIFSRFMHLVRGTAALPAT